MSTYGVIYDKFWDGASGLCIREHGGRAGQLCAVYLLKNSQDNMLGLYPLNLQIMRVTIGTLSAKEIERGIVAAGRACFADYDVTTGHVWVRELATYRLNLNGDPLKSSDKRAIGAANLFAKIKLNPFSSKFYRKYKGQIPSLTSPRRYEGVWKPLRSPFDEARKPETEPVTETEPLQQIKSEQVDQDPRADARPVHKALQKVAHDVLDEIAEEQKFDPRDVEDGEIRERMKLMAAERLLIYDSTSIRAALDAAVKTRAKRSA